MEEIEFVCEGFLLPLISVEEMCVEYLIAAPAPDYAEWEGIFQEGCDE